MYSGQLRPGYQTANMACAQSAHEGFVVSPTCMNILMIYFHSQTIQAQSNLGTSLANSFSRVRCTSNVL